MVYKNDDFLYNLNRPLMMAGDDDEDDELFGDDDDDDMDDDPISDEPLSSDDDDDDDDREPSVHAEKAEAQETSGGRNSTGITRNSLGFGLLAFSSIIPLVLLILYMIKGSGLSMSALLFMVAFFLGMLLSVWTFLYYKSGVSSFSRFDVHSYFKWPEIVVISVILLSVSFYNLSTLYSGGSLRLSSQSTITTQQPAPIFAPQPPAIEYGYEENEVLYETQEFSPVQGNKKVQEKKPETNNSQKNIIQKPKVRNTNIIPSPFVRNTQRAVTRIKPATVNTIAPVKSAANNASPIVNPSSKHHEDEEGTSTTSGQKMQDVVDDALNIAQISANNYSNLSSSKVQVNHEVTTNNNVETTPLVNSLFLGGVLCAALGYAFPLAIAGAILGLFRKFNHPFAAKVKEIINEETGEITLETEAQTTVSKLLDFVFRFFIGFNMGGTVGFLLGIVITIPLYLMFWDKDPMTSRFIETLGVVKNPDLAYATGLIVSGIMVPIIMMVVGKASPAGMTITEEKVRQVYSIPVSINKVSTDMTTIPEPAIISFDLDDTEKEKDGLVVDEFSEDVKESITQDLLSEFGVELENIFGMKVDIHAKSNGDNGKVTNYEKQKVNTILENSLGELGNVSVQVSAELGKASIMLTDWLNLSEGMLIELDKPVSEEIDILINDVCKGKGKLAVVDNHLSVKVSKAQFSQSKN